MIAGGGSGRRALSGGKATRGPERVPLLGGASLVHGETIGFVEAPNSMAVTPRSGRSTAFTGAGRSLMEKEAARGLIDEAEESVDEVRCCGQEQNLYSALARLPAIHTVGVLSLWFVFGRTFLLLEHPDLAVLIVTFFMLYGIFRFWLMWGSAFAAMHSIRKSDSREKNYWQSKPRPPGPDFYSVWHAVMVPNYKEPIEKLRQTLDTLADQTIAHQVVVVMAMESRDPKAVETAEQLEREYSDRLGGFCYALHPLFDGEVMFPHALLTRRYKKISRPNQPLRRTPYRAKMSEGFPERGKHIFQSLKISPNTCFAVILESLKIPQTLVFLSPGGRQEQ